MKRKFLALTLALALVLSLLAFGTSAAGTTETVSAAIDITTDTTYENVTFERADGYTGTIFNVTGGTLTLKNCVVDAGADWEIDQTAIDAAIADYTSATATMADYVTEGTNNVVSTGSIIVLDNDADLALTGTTLKNFYTDNSANQLIKLVGSGENQVVMDSVEITKIAGAKAASIVGVGDTDDLTIKGASKIHGNIGTDPGALISICGTEPTAAQTVITLQDTVEISDNYSINGSVVMIRRCAGIMDGGKFYDNYCIYTGANQNCVPLYIHDYSAFTMTGGEISDNHCYRAALVAMAGSELNFEGGVIGPVKSSSASVTNSVMANTNVTVGEEMTMEQGVLAVGYLENAGTIKGDVIAMQNVVNTGEIGGDAIAANGNVTNSGTVSGDVLAENGTVDNSGTISGSLTTKDGPIVAYVGGVGYDSLADAITAAGSGTVVLQGSQTENTTVGNTVTIEVPAGVTFTTDETGLKVVASSGCTLTTGGTAGAYTYTAEKIVTAPAYAGPVMNWGKVNAANNGVVKSGPLAASAGATVTLYPKAAEGYVLDTVEVLDAEGNAVALDGLKFAIPAGGVTVNATFKPAQ